MKKYIHELESDSYNHTIMRFFESPYDMKIVNKCAKIYDEFKNVDKEKLDFLLRSISTAGYEMGYLSNKNLSDYLDE